MKPQSFIFIFCHFEGREITLEARQRQVILIEFRV